MPGLPSLEERRPRRGRTAPCSSLGRGSAEAGAILCSPGTEGRRRGDSTELRQGRDGLGTRQSSCPGRVPKLEQAS